GSVDVLLVEDHTDTAEALSEFLRKHGFRVRVAITLAEARAAASESFDVLVSDIQLPDGTGLELMNEVRMRRSVPAIAMSGFGSQEDVQRSFDAGFGLHLVKPVTGMQVIEAIESVLSRPH